MSWSRACSAVCGRAWSWWSDVSVVLNKWNIIWLEDRIGALMLPTMKTGGSLWLPDMPPHTGTLGHTGSSPQVPLSDKPSAYTVRQPPPRPSVLYCQWDYGLVRKQNTMPLKLMTKVYQHEFNDQQKCTRQTPWKLLRCHAYVTTFQQDNVYPHTAHVTTTFRSNSMLYIVYFKTLRIFGMVLYYTIVVMIAVIPPVTFTRLLLALPLISAEPRVFRRLISVKFYGNQLSATNHIVAEQLANHRASWDFRWRHVYSAQFWDVSHASNT